MVSKSTEGTFRNPPGKSMYFGSFGVFWGFVVVWVFWFGQIFYLVGIFHLLAFSLFCWGFFLFYLKSTLSSPATFPRVSGVNLQVQMPLPELSQRTLAPSLAPTLMAPVS